MRIAMQDIYEMLNIGKEVAVPFKLLKDLGFTAYSSVDCIGGLMLETPEGITPVLAFTTLAERWEECDVEL